MAGEDNCRLRKSEDLFPDPCEQQFGIAARKVPTSDPAGKQNIATDQHSPFGQMKTQASRTVPRHVQHSHRLASRTPTRLLVNQLVRFEWLDVEAKSMTPEKCRIRRHWGRVRMVADSTAMALLDLRCVGGVVKVPVREQQPVNSGLGEVLIGARRGIKEDVPPRGFQQIRIGVEGAAGEDFELFHA